MKVERKVIVVTGAGSGIGRALVLALVKKGARVAAVDLNETSLHETIALAGAAQGTISAHTLNIADQTAVEALPTAVIAAHGAVDGVINNAGIIQPFVSFSDLAYDAIDRVLKVNLYGVIYMTKAFLPHLKQRPEAHIVNVSSMGGFFPFPGQTLYGASKAGVKLLTEGLYAELLDTKVKVTIVFPGAIATNITQNSGISGMPQADSDAGQGFQMTSASDAADIIIRGMERDHFQVYIGKDATFMNLFYRLSPRRATRYIQKKMKAMLPPST